MIKTIKITLEIMEDNQNSVLTFYSSKNTDVAETIFKSLETIEIVKERALQEKWKNWNEWEGDKDNEK